MAKAAWNRTIVDASGNVLPGADITVTDERTGTLATLFDDREGNDAKSNPFVADSNGFARFFAEPGVYRVVAESGALSRTWRYQSLLDNALPITWTDEQTFTDKVTVDDELEVTGDVEIGGNADITGNVDIDGDVTIDGETTFNGELPQFTGMIAAFGTSTPPAGWLVADGAAVSRSTYAELFAVIGTTWGVGNGSTTFNVPDLREAAPVGIGTRGTTAPDTYTLAQFKNDRFQGHFHRLRSGTGGLIVTGDGHDSIRATIPDVSPPAAGTILGNAAEILTDNVNGSPRIGETTRGKRVGVQYCIKF